MKKTYINTLWGSAVVSIVIMLIYCALHQYAHFTLFDPPRMMTVETVIVGFGAGLLVYLLHRGDKNTAETVIFSSLISLGVSFLCITLTVFAWVRLLG